MTKEEFHKMMDRPFELTQEETHSITKLIEKYPYFQTARLLSLRGIKEHVRAEYDESLKKAAAYSTDRTLLFDYITYKKNLEKNKKIKTKEDLPSTKSDSTKLVEFNKNELHSFSEWLKHSIPSVKKKQHDTFSAIDRFIELNPKLSPLKERQENVDIAMNSITENQDLITETLAKIYVEQKKYDKAIQAFKILSLKYPEKNSFFANQINAIKKLDKK